MSFDKHFTDETERQIRQHLESKKRQRNKKTRLIDLFWIGVFDIILTFFFIVIIQITGLFDFGF